MSQNVTHTKKIARALAERTEMPYTRARKQVVAAMEAGVLPEPYNDEALAGLVDVLVRLQDDSAVSGQAGAQPTVQSAGVPVVAGGPGSQTVLHNATPEVPMLAEDTAEAKDDAEGGPLDDEELDRRYPWRKLPHPWYEVDTRDVAKALRRVAVLIAAHMPTGQAFSVVAQTTREPALQAALADVAVLVVEGWPLPEALGAYPRLFDAFVVAMVASGLMLDRTLQAVVDTLMVEPPRTLLRLGEGNIVLERGPRPVAEGA